MQQTGTKLKDADMHEMSIALSIIDLATEQAKKANASKINEIELDIGTLSGVEIEALNFAMELAVKDTMLESSQVRINHIKALSECQESSHQFDASFVINPCPKCNELNTRIVVGQELQVKSLIIE